MRKRNGVNWSKIPNAKARRYNAMSRLEAQLKSGNKTTKSGDVVELSDKDKKRISKEVEILKERI
jgi:hypothetical protein